MATPAENIQTAIETLTAQIAANPTAMSYSIDGQSVSHDQATAKLESLLKIQAMLQGPVEVVSYGVI